MTRLPFLGLHDPFSSLSHFAAAASALAGAFILYRKGQGNPLRSAALLVFSASLLFLFSMSGIYHGLGPGPQRVFFRRLDYAAIWLVIAGSATPVQMLLLKGRWRWNMTILFWGVAITCLVLVDSYFSRMPYWAIVSAYIGCGLLGIISFSRIMRRYGWRETTLLFLGGLCYIAGAVIDYLEGPIVLQGVLGPHELFHLLVIAGALLHWCFIYGRADRRLPSPKALWRVLRLKWRRAPSALPGPVPPPLSAP